MAKGVRRNKAQPPKLQEYIADWRGKQWEWGSHDCVTFAADWVKLQTGKDPMAAFRGKYANKAEGDDVLAEGGGLVALFNDASEETGPRPDVCVLTWPAGNQTAGLCNNDRVWVFTPKGIASFQRSIVANRLTTFS